MAGATDRGAAAGPALLGVAALAVFAALVRASRPLLAGTDPFWHYDIGRRMVSDGRPRTDPYSFLRQGEEWILNQWGTEAIIGLVNAIGGLSGLAIFTALLVMGAFAAVGWQMWRRSPSLVTMLMFGAVILASMSNWSLRGNLLTFLVLPFFIRELLRDGRPRPVILLPLLVVWANLHAAFLFGVALLLLHLAAVWLVNGPDVSDWLRRRGLILAVGAFIAGAINPYGPRFLISTFELATRAGGAGISEWMPAPPTRPDVLPYTVLVALVLVSLALVGRRDDFPQTLVAVAAALFGFTAIRNLAAASIVVGIVGAPYVHHAWLELRQRSPVAPRAAGTAERAMAAALLVGGVVGVVLVVPPTDRLDAHMHESIPLQLIRQLDAERGQHRVVTTSTWAGAVAALTGDHVRTAVDGRLELFSDEEIQTIRDLESANPGWETTLVDWCVTDVVVPTDSPLASGLSSAAPWQVTGRAQTLTPRDESIRYSRSMVDCPHNKAE